MRAHTDRPAVLALAGDLTGLRVLDIGCGAGHYIAELRTRGAAEVFGVDGGDTLLGHAREHIKDHPAVTLRRHDLEEPPAFLDDGSFGLVVMALVHHHVEARRELLAEAHRVLRPGGVLLVSTTHPAADRTWHGGSYFDEERVVEPQATEEARHIDERWYRKTRHTPFFLAVRMRKTR
ncbi:class I SAM-dependent methyltransferase [Saccharothrix sp. S26]|uniref:class I SAM-dependent methyltransferase n=1 Tax=Saccharothrix sp. S26 TaxID=2907215 RepID=UPI001F24CD3F|nr:class I SAM-dependent methyltransferase [Saccharothrix sp. S26]MCE6995285.1 class I SAM-dependent methyltransferase [Saccharothrix sp. S26]